MGLKNYANIWMFAKNNMILQRKQLYNIGNPEPEISITHLVEMITKVLDYKIPYEVIDYPDNYPSNEPNRRCPDIRKAQKYLGYNPQVKLEDGLKRFFSWTDSNYIGEQ